MSEQVHAASLWWGDAPATRIDSAALVETEHGYKLRVSRKRWQDNDLPPDVTDYALVVTTANGEHLNSEVRDHTHTPASEELHFRTDPITILP